MTKRANFSNTNYGETSGGTTTETPGNNRTSNTTISMAEYHDNYAGNVVVVGTDGNDEFTNHADEVTISGGAGNDQINNKLHDNVSISGGAGDDTIDCYESELTTINGGAGNDLIKLWSYTANTTLQYSNGDGYDTVEGWGDKDTLYIAGSYTIQEQEVDYFWKDITINVGNGSILLKHVFEDNSVNIITVPEGTFGTSDVSSYNNYSYNDYGYEDYSDYGYGDSSVASDDDYYSSNNSYSASDYYYVYTGGDQYIDDYEGERIFIGMLPTGLDFIGDDFYFYSDSGTLTILDIQDKVIDFRDGAGNPFALAYAATNPGTIDGRNLAGFEYLVGSNFGSDIIYAGDNGSNLWGNTGNAEDILVGGGGFDRFFYGKNDGEDMIVSASANDFINLYDVTLNDIAITASDGNVVGLGFNTGGILTVQGSDNLSAKFILADGSSFRFNYATQAWQGA